jgi:hypothetical protein
MKRDQPSQNILVQRNDLVNARFSMTTRNNLQLLGLENWQIDVVLKKVGASGESGIWKLVNEIKLARRDGVIKGSVGGFTARRLDKYYKLGFFKESE